MGIYDKYIKALYEARQVEQGNAPNFEIISYNEHGYHVGKLSGGVDWDNTEEGYGFWSNLLKYGVSSRYYNQVPKIDTNTISISELKRKADA